MDGFLPFDLVSPPSFSYFESLISAFTTPLAGPPSALLANELHRYCLLDHTFNLLSPTTFFDSDLLPPSVIDFHTAADHTFAFDCSSFASLNCLNNQVNTFFVIMTYIIMSSGMQWEEQEELTDPGGYRGWLLYTVASFGDMSFVWELLERNPLVVSSEGEYGVTDIFYATVRSKNSDVCRLLFDFAVSPRSSSGGVGGVDDGSGEFDFNFGWEMVNRAQHQYKV
ncbi:hypothetical protein ZIOFF_034947 [Zingiber officinale]|uniref:Uncharacterized protein n=1 Tax=Zingiber officinale TaxID=94328 RepID=A0A8J5L6R4_ZINOF|nr:hypothetical protein ZIOFF_034947 [Zingiber officinale]